MTDANFTLPYASPQSGGCPLCQLRPISNKTIYGHRVCKKYVYAFANRRQGGYLIDALLYALPLYWVLYFVFTWLERSGMDELALKVIAFVCGLITMCVFIMKDGFGGQSPGKRLTGVITLDEQTGQPIGFGQSFKRNAVFLLGQIPTIVGGVIGLVVLVVIAFKVGSGYRLGDKFSQTKVIWKRYAESPVFGGRVSGFPVIMPAVAMANPAPQGEQSTGQ